MNITDIERLTVDVMRRHGCHTAILYGSWVRGQATPQSDVDILCVRDAGPAFRDARVIDGIYLDAFVYPEADLLTPQPELLRALGGRVIQEQGGFGSALLAKLQDLYDRGPTPMADDMRQVSVIWADKMLDRFRGQSDMEAQYRRMQLLMQSLEDYFALRGIWFRGPKEAFAWLLEHDLATHLRFEAALRSGASDAAFAALVQSVYGAFAEHGPERAEPRETEALIRSAVASDAEEIAAVHVSAIRDVCGQVYDPRQIHAWISGKTQQGYLRAIAEHRVFVALRDERVVGFSELDPKTGEVFDDYVRHDCLRQGLGGHLLQTLEICAAEHALERLHLHATLNAIPFYEAHGFVLDVMTSFPLSPDTSLACARMHKQLNRSVKLPQGDGR